MLCEDRPRYVCEHQMGLQLLFYWYGCPGRTRPTCVLAHAPTATWLPCRWLGCASCRPTGRRCRRRRSGTPLCRRWPARRHWWSRATRVRAGGWCWAAGGDQWWPALASHGLVGSDRALDGPGCAAAGPWGVLGRGQRIAACDAAARPKDARWSCKPTTLRSQTPTARHCTCLARKHIHIYPLCGAPQAAARAPKSHSTWPRPGTGALPLHSHAASVLSAWRGAWRLRRATRTAVLWASRFGSAAVWQVGAGACCALESTKGKCRHARGALRVCMV